jgi:hypothetical protein
MKVVFEFIHGMWTYRPGETYTEDELLERGFAEEDIRWWKFRGALEEEEPVGAKPVEVSSQDIPLSPAPDEC